MPKQLLSNKLFHEKILRLETACRVNRLSQESLNIYYEKLRYFTDDDFNKVIEQIIETESFFPSIAKILELKPDESQAALTYDQLLSLNK